MLLIFEYVKHSEFRENIESDLGLDRRLILAIGTYYYKVRSMSFFHFVGSIDASARIKRLDLDDCEGK